MGNLFVYVETALDGEKIDSLVSSVHSGRGFNGKTRRKIVTRRIVENYREKDLVLNDYDRCRKFFSRLHIIRKTENKDFIMAPSKVLKIYFYILGILEDIYILEIVLIDRIAFRNFKIYDGKREREE